MFLWRGKVFNVLMKTEMNALTCGKAQSHSLSNLGTSLLIPKVACLREPPLHSSPNSSPVANVTIDRLFKQSRK